MERCQQMAGMYSDISAFHHKFQLSPYENYFSMPLTLIKFREGFIQEEATEIINALSAKNQEDALDGFVDLAYVTLGTLYLMEVPSYKVMHKGQDYGITNILNLSRGFQFNQDSERYLIDLAHSCRNMSLGLGFYFDEAWKRVHEANMSKVRATSETDGKRDATWDVVKPEGWKAPDLTDLV